MKEIRLFTQPAEKDHPERPGLINISRTKLVLLLSTLCSSPCMLLQQDVKTARRPSMQSAGV
jgi:hypothetical protein